MKRRQFLSICSVAGLAALLNDSSSAFGQEPLAMAPDDLRGLLIIDPHAHPEQMHGSRRYDPTTPSLSMLKSAGVALCAFSAVGDATFFRGGSGTPFNDTQAQLGRARRLAEKGELQLVLGRGDLQALKPAPDVPFGLLAIEGGDALEGSLENLDAFFRDGVRMMTLVHERDNEIGHNQRSDTDGPLTPFGAQVVEHMNELGMLVDVAHAKTATLKSVTEVAKMPIIDSHTGPFLPGEEGRGSRRLRSWQEMEWIAGTGGVVCTWPFGFSGRRSERTTLRHWAAEVMRMKSRLGIEHCGLGTDGGGGLPQVVEGWESIASLPALARALRDAGLSANDLAAFVGGNVVRVLDRCLPM